jgi:O-antigen ligase
MRIDIRRGLYVCHCLLVILAFWTLGWIAIHQEILGLSQSTKRPASDWIPNLEVVIPSLFAIGMLVFAPLRPQLGLLAYIAIGYGFPRQESYEFFLRWHVLEAISLLSISALIVSQFLQRRANVDFQSDPARLILRHPLFIFITALVSWILISALASSLYGGYQPVLNHSPIQMLDGWCLFVVAAYCMRTDLTWWYLGITFSLTLCLRAALAPRYIHLEGDMGVLLSLGIPLALATLAVAKTIPAKLVALVFAGMQSFTLYMTENRGGLVALGAAMIVLWLASRWKWRLLVVITPVALIAATFFVESGYWHRFEDIWKGGSNRGSVDSRLLIYEAGLKMTYRNPVFGVGIGNFEPQMSKYSRNGKSDSPHNNVIGMFAETGFLGGLLYVALFGCSIGLCLMQARRKQTELMQLVAPGLGATLTAYIVSGMFMTRHTLELAYLLVGGVVAINTLQTKETSFGNQVTEEKVSPKKEQY